MDNKELLQMFTEEEANLLSEQQKTERMVEAGNVDLHRYAGALAFVRGLIVKINQKVEEEEKCNSEKK